MIDKLLYPRSRTFPIALVVSLWILNIILFGLLRGQAGLIAGTFAILPVIGVSWYFGFRIGVAASALIIAINTIFFLGADYSVLLRETYLGYWLGFLALLLVAAVTGGLKATISQRQNALMQLQQLQSEQEQHSHFISALDQITWIALDAKDLVSTLSVLVKQIGELFEADDCFFALWDEASKSPIPTVAYGSASDVYPSIRLDPGVPSLAAKILESERPLAITDFGDSPYRQFLNPKLAEIFGGGSVLGLPLITREHKLGVMYLTYKSRQIFGEREIENGRLAARQIALVLARIQSFEETQQRVKELAILHEVALAPMQVDSVDKLLELAMEIIGRSLFPDNFGILLLDEKTGTLQAHSSYRTYPHADYNPREIIVSLGQGVCGEVAQSGNPQRVGDVRELVNYLNVDSRMRSELCVPLKVKSRVLGVINAESITLNAFTAYDEKLLDTLAGQLATAIEYLRTLDAERNWMNRLAHSNELITALSNLATKIEKMSGPAEVIKTLQEEFLKMGLKSLLSLYLSETDQMVIQYSPLLSQPDEMQAADAFGYRVRAEKMESLFGIENVFVPMVLPDPLETIKIVLSGFRESDISSTMRAAGVTAESEIIHLPLLFEDRLLGALWVWGRDITGMDLPILTVFARQIAITLENARLLEETQNLVLTDPLTGLYNRRGLFEIGKIEFARSHRAERPFSAIMADLDHFKQINDNYGHFTGDCVLQNFASHCRESVRDVDLIGRYGGEEIVILLPETDLQTAVIVAERLREAVANNPLQIADEIAIEVTASFGVAQMDEHTLNLETLIARADQAMYIAKHKGRDRVAISK